MLRKLIFFLCLTHSAIWAQDSWKIEEAKVVFKIKNAGLEVEGTFEKPKIELYWDTKNVENSKIFAALNVNSINTGIAMRDNHLRKEEYFDVKKYPLIEMNLIKISQKDGGQFVGSFKLTLKGNTRQVELPFKAFNTNGMYEFKGELSIKRLDYNIGDKSWMMSNDVKIQINLVTKP